MDWFEIGICMLATACVITAGLRVPDYLSLDMDNRVWICTAQYGVYQLVTSMC